jgi:hypothetical protein
MLCTTNDPHPLRRAISTLHMLRPFPDWMRLYSQARRPGLPAWLLLLLPLLLLPLLLLPAAAGCCCSGPCRCLLILLAAGCCAAAPPHAQL